MTKESSCTGLIVPDVYCDMSVCFWSERNATLFIADVVKYMDINVAAKKPRSINSWYVTVSIVKQKRCWDLNVALSSLMDLVEPYRASLMADIVRHGGEVIVDIALYAYEDLYPAIRLSKEMLAAIASWNAEISIDLV